MNHVNNHVFEFRVYAEDVDYMGIVYHANYLFFFERARTELLRAFGHSLTIFASKETYFAIREVRIRYDAPAKLDDILSIHTVVNSFRTGMDFNQSMFNQEQRLLSEAFVRVVCISNTFKPKRLPVELKL